MPDGSDTQVRERLARQRTELANERTLLAYIRTALGFVIVGVPAVWLMEQPLLQVLGWLALAAGAGCLAVGIRRFFSIKAGLEHEPQ
jgi:putative membrane protein